MVHKFLDDHVGAAYCGCAFVCVSWIRFTFLSFVQNWKFGNWTFLFLSKISEKHFRNFFVSTWLLYFRCRLFSPLRPIRKKHLFQLLPECFLSILLSSRSSKISSKLLFRLLKLGFNFISENLHWSVNNF